MRKIEWVQIPSEADTFYKLTINDVNIDVWVQSSPFANCQLSGISYIRAILGYDVTTEEFEEIMFQLYCKCSKAGTMIDVNSGLSDSILKLFKPYCKNIISTPYTSTNGSNMIFHILQFDPLILEKFYKRRYTNG